MNNLSEQFEGIYDKYISKIYRFVYLKVNSQEIAEDITSKVFMKGWEAFQRNNGSIENAGAFLYRIARNAVIDHYREKDKNKTVSVDNVPLLADNGTNLQDLAIIDSELKAVKTAIQSLKKDYQDIIIWHYLEGMKVAEIAGILDKPQGTVRVMLHRGLQTLKKELSQVQEV